MNCVSFHLAVFTAFFLLACTLGEGEINSKLVFVKVSRKIDLASQLAKFETSISLENGGDSSVSFFYFAIEPSLLDKLAYVGITAKPEDDDETSLKLTEAKLDTPSKTRTYRVDLSQPLNPGSSLSLKVDEVFAHAMRPFPIKITQSERQYVLFAGNHYVYSLYPVKSQTTLVTLASSTVESYTKEKPTSQQDSTVTYGPYTDVEPLKQSPMRIHFENNSPFLSVLDMLRMVEISHWGNIAVEETYHMKHVGAELKGPFSRYDYQRTPAPASIKSFKTILPAAASDVYYRDEIGNISTSNMLSQDDSVDLELKPRFPLFGGWQTRYYIGYNVPTYEYLYNSGNNYVLKMRFVDHIYDDFIIDHMTLKIILPEGAKDIRFKAPFEFTQGKQELHHTYLDTIGRPVVVIHKDNLMEQHITDFELHYSFNKVLLLQEPLLVVGAFYLLFMLVIIYVRMDFAISKDEASEARMRAAGLIEEVQRLLDRRSGLYNFYSDAINKFKSSKDSSSFATARKKLDSDYRSISSHITQNQSALSKEQPEAADKIGELQRKEHERKVLQDQAIIMAEKVVSGRMNKQSYVDNENTNKTKREKLTEEIDSIASSL